MEQIQLVPGTSDNKTDCMLCSAYWPNGDGIFMCKFIGEAEVHKCECCGFCNSFKPITDKDRDWLKADFEAGRIVKTTFNRYRWTDPMKGEWDP